MICCNTPSNKYRRRTALRVGKAGAVGSGVIAVAGGEIPAREECIAGGCARQASHIVERELVGPGGVRHLGQARIVIVGVIHRGGIRIGLHVQPVQLVVSVGYLLVLAVILRGIESSRFLERAMGIEPTSEAWEALNKTLKAIDLAALSFPSDGLNWKLDGN